MTACLSAILTMIVIAQQPTLPRHHPLSDEYRREWEQSYRNWPPGPKVAAAVKRLDDCAADLRAQFAREEISMKRFSIEWQRVSIHRHLLLCIALVASPRDETPELVVVLTNNREMMRVFPAGMPAEELKPNQIYETEPGGRRRVRYLTTYRWDGGEKFAVFAREPDARQ
jgi:hypothetical protein